MISMTSREAASHFFTDVDRAIYVNATAALTFNLDASGGNHLGGSKLGGLNIIE